MAIPTLLLPLDGDLEGRDRDGLITATGQGALRWVPGMAPGTQAAMVEESTTNLLWNPTLLHSTSYWSKNSATTIERVSCPWNPAIYAASAYRSEDIPPGTISVRQIEDYVGLNRVAVT